MLPVRKFRLHARRDPGFASHFMLTRNKQKSCCVQAGVSRKYAVASPPASAQTNLIGLWQSRPFSCRTEPIQRPNILRHIMAENKIIAIHRSDAEIGCAGRIPLILNFHDFKQMAPQSEPNGSLIGAISGIAFDAHFAHRCPHNRTAIRRVYSDSPWKSVWGFLSSVSIWLEVLVAQASVYATAGSKSGFAQG